MKKSSKAALITVGVIGIIGIGGTAANNNNQTDNQTESTTSFATVSESNTESTNSETETFKNITEDIWETEENQPIATTSEYEAIAETINETEKIKQMFVLNTNTMKIHYPSCSSVKDIKPENYSETYDYEEAISQGYEACGKCHAS